MDNIRMCVLDEEKVCDDCGECNRCDLDPNKVCDNCCRCIAMEDEGNEFRSLTVDSDGIVGGRLSKPAGRPEKKKRKTPAKEEQRDISEEPSELTPELVEYWEKKLQEYGEAPADDGFGEIEVNPKIPSYGKRVKPQSRRND